MTSPSIFWTVEEVVRRNPDNAIDLAKWFGPPLNQALVDDAEAQLGVKLPESYLQLLRQQNGGFLKIDWLQIDAPGSDQTHALCQNLPGLGYGLGLDGESGSIQLIETWEYPQGLVYLTGDGHTGICLDYRKCGTAGEPTICWIDTEGEPIGDYQIASDFQELIHRIERHTHELE
jgi:hypothetical protein